jgi:muconolactone D-isomerase
MLFMVEMQVKVPPGVDLWRVAGQYANVSIFDVESPAALHDLMMGLPLFKYMETKVTALCRHPSSIHTDDR